MTRTDTAGWGRAAVPADMALAGPRGRLVPVAPPRSQIDVVIPVYNEERDLERCVLRLYAHLKAHVPYTARITIADNASTDDTWQVARRLAEEIPDVRAVHLDHKGRGRTLRQVWLDSDADVLAYMDVDLSTDLAAFLPLVAPLLSGHSDLAIGTRLGRGSRVVRGAKREVISRSYNVLLRMTLGARFSDAQCGFKAIRAERARDLLPLVEDDGWFFDTELLVPAERVGLRIHEVPVDWVDDPDSRVEVSQTARDDLRGMVRLGRSLASGRLPLAALRSEAETRAELAAVRAPTEMLGQLLTFAVVGVVSTLAYLTLYLILRDTVSAQAANAIALAVTAVANTVVNRRVTFGVRGPRGRVRHVLQGLVVFAAGLAVTAGSLALLEALVTDPARAVEVVVLLTASALATLLRFVLYRAWIFPIRSGASEPVAAGTTTSPTTETPGATA